MCTPVLVEKSPMTISVAVPARGATTPREIGRSATICWSAAHDLLVENVSMHRRFAAAAYRWRPVRSAPRRASRRLPSSGTRRRSTRASVGPAPWPARGRCRSCTRSPRRVFPRQRSSRRLSTRWPMVTSGARPATDGPGLVVSESPCASPKSASMLFNRFAGVWKDRIPQ